MKSDNKDWTRFLENIQLKEPEEAQEPEESRKNKQRHKKENKRDRQHKQLENADSSCGVIAWRDLQLYSTYYPTAID